MTRVRPIAVDRGPLGLVVTGLVLLCACGGPSAVRHASPACPPGEVAEAVGLLSTNSRLRQGRARPDLRLPGLASSRAEPGSLGALLRRRRLRAGYHRSGGAA